MEFGVKGIFYFPTLGIRPSEMRALEELPEKTKDRLRPTVLFAPWVGSHSLSASLERVTKAFKGRPFYLDIDRSYWSEKARPAVEEFFAIRDEGGDYGEYFSIIRNCEFAIPTIQLENTDSSGVSAQIQAANEIGRGFMLRLTRGTYSEEKLSHVLGVCRTGLANFVVEIDCEWTDDFLQAEAWASGIIDRMTEVGSSPTTIICSTSFPKAFSDIVGMKEIQIGSRMLYERMTSRFGNQIQLLYGDWATTRPREYSGGQTPPPRIDYPALDRWLLLRDPDTWNYQQAAKALLNSSAWDSTINVWGKVQIEKTAAGDVSGITTAAGNVAARINLHLHIQSWAGDEAGLVDTDDPWIDEV